MGFSAQICSVHAQAVILCTLIHARAPATTTTLLAMLVRAVTGGVKDSIALWADLYGILAHTLSCTFVTSSTKRQDQVTFWLLDLGIYTKFRST